MPRLSGNALKLLIILLFGFFACSLYAEDEEINLLGDDLVEEEEDFSDLLNTDVDEDEEEEEEEEEEDVVTPFRGKTAEQLHFEVFEKAKGYPSAADCATCHQQIYYEWSISNHAYASISPMFHKFEQKISELSKGTVNYFCLRCHSSVGTTLGEERHLPPWEKPDVSNEGVTCISCHRIDEEYGRVNGERRIVPGNMAAPVYGTSDGEGIREALKEALGNVIAQDPSPKGKRSIHSAGIKFRTLDKSEYCMSCHQVAVHPGIKLEVVWEQYRDSPAVKNGISCQDCHMGKVPGRAEGYETGPAAIIGGKLALEGGERGPDGKLTGKAKLVERDGKVVGEVINPNRKHANHAMWGPGYPIVHPGIFPQNLKTKTDPNYDFSFEAWLTFDWRAGWGSDEFEKKLREGEIEAEFPPEWDKRRWRMNAWQIVEQNLELLELKKQKRLEVMENGSRIDGPFFKTDNIQSGKNLKFDYKITNTDEGHNLPSGSLGAQPEIWLNVALIDPDGNNVWESGYVDSNGDMCDLHSIDVRNGKIKRDKQLFNLQTKFLTTNVKGTDREVYLPLPFDVDPNPMLRPAGLPVTVMNHPPLIRMEGRSIPPMGSKTASYTVPGSALKKPGKYKLQVRMRSRAEPIYFMKYVGATPEMERAMNEWMIDIHPYAVEFDVK